MRCSKRYLGYKVSDAAWLDQVPEASRGKCLCMGCYLNFGTTVSVRSWSTALVAVMIIIAATAAACRFQGARLLKCFE